MSDALLGATDVSVTFGSGSHRVAAVRKVSLAVRQGEAIGIVGESGSGKSTLARVLVRPPASGRRFGALSRPVDLRRWPRLSRHDAPRSADGVSGSLQQPQSAHDGAGRGCRGLPLPRQVARRPRPARRRSSSSPAWASAPATLARSRASCPAVSASGRASPARSPPGLRSSSPTSRPPPSTRARRRSCSISSTVCRGDGLSIILISHDLAVIRYLAKRVYVMRDGEFVETGDTLDVFERPQHAYTRALIASIPGRIARVGCGGHLRGMNTLQSDRKDLARMTPAKVAALYDLTGRIALITGGAAGIGFACARHLGAAGATVIIVDIREKELAEAVRSLTADGIRAIGWVGDISKEDVVDALVDRARKEIGLVDILVNNAGVGSHALPEKVELA